MTKLQMRKLTDANKTASGQHRNNLHSNCQMEEDVFDVHLQEDATLPMCLRRGALNAGNADDADDAETPTATDAGDDDDDDDEVNSSSSFCLEECLNEFRSRRLRRESTHSRDGAAGDGEPVELGKKNTADRFDPAEEDLINQNRCNKEQERKCKPCQNGFCYCFTSDSGDGGGGSCSAARTTTARAVHVRSARRHRKSESNQPHVVVQKQPPPSKSKERRRQSAADQSKTPVQTPKKEQQNASAAVSADGEQLTAISRLETSSKDAPLIHIIQELHNNCVISEVRVNKDKIHAQQQQQNTARTFTSTVNSPQKRLQYTADLQLNGQPAPSAPPLEKISEIDSPFEGDYIASSPLNSSGRSEESARRRHKYGGRLLQKRLSRSQIEYKPSDWCQQQSPPPKPPRTALHTERKSSVSSLASTSASVREAERILDAFLLSKGLRVTGNAHDIHTRRSQRKIETTRKSYPSIRPNSKSYTLPTCPSLADLRGVEHTINNNNKNHANYAKNIRNGDDKTVKELSFGWKEPKICDMLNYDTNNSNRKQFKSQECQAEPQAIGWHMASGGPPPKSDSAQVGWKIPPKIDLDTVDCGVGSNLAANISNKTTPVKSRLFSAKKQKPNASQKFMWGEQLRNFSPWSSAKKRTSPQAAGKSRGFLNQSRRRILRLVSPKKNNQREQAAAKPQQCTIGVQTTGEGWRSFEPQSPPGSYHSAVQTSQQSSNMSSQSNNRQTPQFDFTRTVQSPPQPKRSQPRPSQRKLNFPIDCGTGMCAAETSGFDECGGGGGDDGVSQLAVGGGRFAKTTKTYRSFHSDLDQDVTLSKMGYILSNIRAKLEASDDHAVRTFQEIERREQNAANFDCTDGAGNVRTQTRVDVHARVRRHIADEPHHDPIYSEIEEDRIHISSSPQFENNTAAPDKPKPPPEVLYATVNKKAKSPVKDTPTRQATPLGKILHDSLKKSHFVLPPLPAEPATGNSDTVSYTTPAPSLVGASQSLNNIRVLEQHSPPKRKNLSKSDLSLQRSEIFLENLCCSEIVVEATGNDNDGTSNTAEYLQKIENCQSYMSFTDTQDRDGNPSSAGDPLSSDDDIVSYELPHEHNDTDSNAGGSHLGISHIQPVDAVNHSTPKKAPPTFTTKPKPHEVNVETAKLQTSNVELGTSGPLSCPSTPQHAAPNVAARLHAVSLNEISSLPRCSNDMTRYKKLKNVLRKSFRKSKNFVKTETKRLSSSLSFPQQQRHHSHSSGHSSNPNASAAVDHSTSTFDLEALFAVDDQTPIDMQIARAVSICRQLPDLEISAEMVEAERLLLFSSLRRRRLQSAAQKPPGHIANVARRYFIDSMRLPIKADVHQDVFFNYFYICTFECNGAISSTQSVECHDHVTIFRDCGIEFVCPADDSWDLSQAVIQCQIFMLRLRKVSTLSLEPRKPIVKLPASSSSSSSSSLSSAGDEIVSRFRLHATFTLRAAHFAPFEYVPHETLNSGRICLRSSRDVRIDLVPCYKSTNLSNAIEISGRADVRLPNRGHCGFLNVQDPYNLHNWNRRWCTLDGLKLVVWQDVNDLKDQPLLTLDLRDSVQCDGAIEAATRELCARPRSFCLQCVICKADERVDIAAVFFAADTLNDLSVWLRHINDVLAFINTWMK